MKTVSDRNVRFLLKDARATGPTLVYLVYRYGDQRFKTSTGQTLEPYQWDATQQRAYTNQKNRAAREPFETINAHLDRYRSAIKQVVTAMLLAQIPLDNDTIKQYLDNTLGRAIAPRKTKEPAPAPFFVDWIADFVADAKAGRKLNAKGGRFSNGTLTNYTTFRNKLIVFQTETGQRLTNDSFTLDFYESFKSYLVRKGNSLNYVGAVLNGVKMLLKQAHGDGIPVGDDCKKREFRKLEEEVDSIYLTNDELQTLFTLDLGDTPRLAKVRDLFLIGCYTGLRFSDFTQLRPANIVLGGRILTVATQKTGARVSIPLNPNVLAILAKYTRTNNADTTGPGTLPRALTNQKFNQYLKELAERAGAVNPAFCSLIERTRTEGGRKETRTVQKWELVTTHTARRSFATNAFLAGLPPESIMKVTGHKSAVMFMKYIKVTTEQNALLLLNHPHFGGSGMPDLLNTVVRPLHRRASD